MKDSDAARLNNNLGRLVEQLKAMNNNHVEIGRLFKAWIETEAPEVEELQLEVDDIVDVVEERSAFYGQTGTVIGIRKDRDIRVMFEGQEGYSIFTADELEKTGEQPYKEA